MGPKVEHGLQTTAIYWEGQANAFKGAFGQPTYGQKWTWKTVDDQIRSLVGLDKDVRQSPLVFIPGSSRVVTRQYHGDRDVQELAFADTKYNFTLFPTGTRDPHAGRTQKGQVSREDVFNAIITSCAKIDFAAKLA